MELFNGLSVSDHARSAQLQTMKFLREKGFAVRMEERVPNRGDGMPGRIDIIAEKQGMVIAIEFDKKTPRQKSLYKLQHYDCTHRVVLLRGGNKNYRINDITVMSIGIKKE